MWSTFHMGHYIPLSWMTLGLDYSLWGMNPAGYHFTNLLLHAANAVLLFVLAGRLLRLSGVVRTVTPAVDAILGAAVAALVFAIHPLRVESVAWITERRDMLSLLFYQASVLFYLGHAGDSTRRRDYALSLLAFLCALLSKGTSVTLPALLLLLNVYPLRRIGGTTGYGNRQARRVYVELLPFVVLSAAASALTIVALKPPHQLGLADKIAVSFYSLAFYLGKTVWPTRLAPLYEMPQPVPALSAGFLVAYVVVAALMVGAWLARRSRPGLTAVAVAFLLVILPMLGIVQNGPQIAADRYTYHAAPLIGLLAAAWFLTATHVARGWRLLIVGSYVAVMGALTWRQAGFWRTSDTLWGRVLDVDERSSIAQVAMGDLDMKQDRVDQAVQHYTRGVAIDEEYAEGHNNLGVALAKQGQIGNAIARYQRALQLKPTLADAHNNWGIALGMQGRYADAIEHYRQTIALDPDNADAHTNWGNALVRLGRPSEALDHYHEAVRVRPDRADPRVNWGVALVQLGRLPEAIEQFRAALEIDPNHADARAYFDRALQMLNGAPQTRP